MKFLQGLATDYDLREVQNMWRIVKEDYFDPYGFDDFNRIIQELQKGKPISYVTGVHYFYENEFAVNKHVLIPRPETEELVSWVLAEHGAKENNVLDIGTGSGCIAISLKLKRPEWKISGMDISLQAMNVAKTNAKSLNADVTFRFGDANSPVMYPDDLDIIVSNPPYVLKRDRVAMSHSVIEYEPEQALFVSDDDPLYFYRRIIKNAISRNNKSLQFYFEIHHLFADEMVALCQKNNLSEIRVKKDMQGESRMLSALFQKKEKARHDA